MRRRAAGITMLLSTLFAAFAAGLPATLAKVQVMTGDTADFSRFLSYAWKTGTPARNPNLEDSIVGSVDQQLRAKGLARVDVEPDLYVRTHVLPDQVSLDELRNSGLEFWSGVTSLSPSDLGAGTLVVDLVDAESGTVVWRGVASETITGTAQTMRRKVEKSIRKMFRSYPSE